MTQNNSAKPPVVSADTDISLKKARKPKGSINWLKLGKDKDPEFDTKVYLYDPSMEDNFFSGYLIEKTESKGKVKYNFELDRFSDAGEIIYCSTATHYAICTPPVE